MKPSVYRKRLFDAAVFCAVVLGGVSLFGCAAEFDPASELKGLRVLAVKKSQPYARPGESVEFSMLWHDGSGEPSRSIQIAWLAGCYNPASDLFSLCFSDGSQFTADLTLVPEGEGGNSADAGAPDKADEQDAGAGAPLPADSKAPSLSVPLPALSGGDPDFPIVLAYGERFSLTVPDKIVSSREAPADKNVPPYGLAYVLFLACAGEVRINPDANVEGGFPFACYDGEERLGAEDFVAGYTSVYAYADKEIENRNPVITGLTIGDQDIDDADLCIDDDCSGEVAPSAKNASCSGLPVVKFCANKDKCEKPVIKPKIKASSAETDSVLTRIRGSEIAEQMWVNYYVDRGEIKDPVRLLNDAQRGWNEDFGASFIATEKGTALLWAVAHDNRGGTSWARTRVCVK